MISIELQFKKALTSLSGNRPGFQTYQKQVRDVVVQHPNEQIQIVFPDRINLITTSFEQGFFNDFIKEFGIEAFDRRIEIVSSIPDLKQTIHNNLEYR